MVFAHALSELRPVEKLLSRKGIAMRSEQNTKLNFHILIKDLLCVFHLCSCLTLALTLGPCVTIIMVGIHC